LGVSKSDSFFQQKELKLNPGDILLLYTDGVTEAMNPQGALFGEERLEKTLRDNRQKPLKELLESVLASVKQFAGEREQSDDITLFGIKFKKEAY
jgi:sigma-B regulation protein RsbU (phosphoserine phosphatase)